MIEQGLALLTGALREVSRASDDLTCAVIGVPMPISDTGGQPLPTPLAAPWIPVDPAAELSRSLDVPVWMENDANLGALGEGAFGAAADMTSFIYIKVAHGIGAGLVLDRRLHRGASGLAGELAHIHVQDDGALCRCGGRGCLMTAFNTPRLIDWIRTVHPDVSSMADVLSLATDRDAGVWRLLRDLGRTIGRSLADFCVYVAPDGLVLDGILQNAGTPVIDGIRETLDQFAPPAIASQVRLAGGLLGDRAELVGAAVLARRYALRGPNTATPSSGDGWMAPVLCNGFSSAWGYTTIAYDAVTGANGGPSATAAPETATTAPLRFRSAPLAALCSSPAPVRTGPYTGSDYATIATAADPSAPRKQTKH